MSSFHIIHRVHLPIPMEDSQKYHIGLSGVSTCILSYRSGDIDQLATTITQLDALWNDDEAIPTQEKIRAFWESIKALALPEGTGFAAVYFTSERAFLYTVGGTVLLSRGGSSTSIIDGTHVAQGPRNDGDTFILLPQLSKGADLTTLYAVGESSEDILENQPTTTHLGHLLVRQVEGEDPIAAALSSQEELVSPVGQQQNGSSLKVSARYFLDRVSTWPRPNIPTKRGYLYIVLVILGGIFIWSVLLGSTRRKEATFIQHSQQTQQEIRDLLSEAEEVAPFDPESAGSLVEEARLKWQGLQEQAKLLKIPLPKELHSIQSQIESSSNAMFKKSNVEMEEFYLFSLLGPDTTVAKAYFVDGSIILLDRKNKSAHAISLDEKAVTTYTSSLLGEAIATTSSKGTIYALIPGKGVFMIPSSGEVSSKPVITPEKWVQPTEITAFNGNIYVLDKTAPYIYKYVPIDSGFSSYREYLTDSTQESLSNPNAITIDGSVYVSASSRITRYISGVKDSFSLKSPDEYSIDGFSVSPEADTIAILDKKRARVLLFSKTGEFLKQIVSTDIERAQSILLDSAGELLLQTEKGIYRIAE